jgi:hypothetical protein
MKSFRFILLLLTLCGTSTLGGEIYGTIKEGDKPVGKGVAIEIKNGEKTYPATTDDFGNYRVIVAEAGKCSITVQFNGQPVSAELQSYWNSARFDWALEKVGDKYSLKRQ